MKSSEIPINNANINDTVEKISSIFNDSALKSFKQKRNVLSKTNTDKIWFGQDCKNAKMAYEGAKSKHNKNPNPVNKTILQEKSKSYKKTMNKYINKHIKNTKINLRSFNKNNPKEFWKIINSLESKQKDETLDINEFHNYFENTNAAAENNDDNNDGDEDEINFNMNGGFDELNQPINAEEITKCVKNLKNNKSFADDHIINEYIKSTLTTMLPIYVDLFNIILDSGIIPDSWLEGIIRPIHKSGDRQNPENYRPITILSCFGKLFTSILNLRLTTLLEDNAILEENQAGFRKGYATTDHIFVLHSLAELLKTRKKKLFCSFIDFSKAFDSVWRAGLWQKLLKNNIDGKFFKIIYNMYQSIKSCVRLNGQVTNFFPCNIGLRQGENLSPVLFSLFLNDLEQFLEDNNCEGINIEYFSEEFSALDKAAYCVHTQLPGHENAIKFISMRTKTQLKSLIRYFEPLHSVQRFRVHRACRHVDGSKQRNWCWVQLYSNIDWGKIHSI